MKNIKRQFHLLIALMFLCSLSVQAEKFTVDNTIDESVPEENLFKTLEEAYNRAINVNDTIYVQGSATTYESLVIERPITLIGPGYFLEENANSQAIKQPASILRIFCNAGSEGSKIIGMNLTQSNLGYIRLRTNDILIKNCYVGSSILLEGTAVSDIMVIGNYFANTSLALTQGANPLVSFYFANNIIIGDFEIPDATTGTIINNVFVGDEFNLGTTSSLEIHNNILLSTEGEEIIVPLVNGTNVSHNIAALQTFGTANGNQINVAESQIFVEEGTTDGQYQIIEDGLAAGTGRDGVDVGAFGGPEPYRLSGVPPIPRITDLSTDGSVNEDGELIITIKATTN